MAHDPSLAYADYFAAGSGGAASSLVQEVDAGETELYGLHHQPGRVEMFGVRGLAMAAASPTTSVDDGSSTIQFVLGEQQHRQMSQAPLSLALHRPAAAEASSLMLHHQLAGGAGATAPWMQGAWHLRGSRFLLPTQQLLQEFCSLPVETSKNPAKPPKPAAQEDGGGGGGSSTASWAPSAQIQTMEAAELQRLKAKLYTMLEEVDRRYRRYCEQMRAVAGSFEAVAGERAAAGYMRLASRTISRHFRSLRDGVAAQLQAVRRALGEKDAGGGAAPGMTKGETPRLRVLDQCLRQHKAYQAGMLETHPWRPQRGLPERAVSILRAWLFEHFLHPYPSDVDKHILARQTGLSRGQVSNWFINARVRLWKPMVEEMYSEEMKDQGEGSGQSQASNGLQNSNPSGYTSEGRGGGGEDAGGEHKPTPAQLLHDAGSLASVVSIGSGGGAAGRMDHQSINFGMMDHLDFDAYEAAGGGQTGFVAGGVSLTLGLQQHADPHGGVNVAAFAAAPPSASQATEYLFMAGEQQVGGAGAGVHSAHGQFGAGLDGGDAASHYRGLSATGFHLLHDLAG